jgi:hypothetical protein
VIKPTANGRPVAALIDDTSAEIHSGPLVGTTPPNDPSAPADDTAAAIMAPVWKAIGANIIGARRPNISVKRVRNMARRLLPTRQSSSLHFYGRSVESSAGTAVGMC